MSIWMGTFSNEVYLGTYFLILLLEICCAVLNGVILVIFASVPALRRNKPLRLVYFLSIGDFLTAILEAPYIIYMIYNWNPTLLQFDPLFILIASIPLPVQLKVSAVITVGIALSRNIAIFFPAKFHQMDHGSYSKYTLYIALSLALFDAILWFSLSPPIPVPNCGTSGCFVSDQFRAYWGISNMILGFIVIFLSITMFFKIKSVQTNNVRVTHSNQHHNTFHQANRTSTGILISSFFFLTIPSTCAGVVELMGYSIFRRVGPFYSASLLASGICNAIVFVGCNRDARRLMRKAKVSTQSISAVHIAWPAAHKI